MVLSITAIAAGIILMLGYSFLGKQNPRIDTSGLNEPNRTISPVVNDAGSNEITPENKTVDSVDYQKFQTAEILKNTINLLPEPDYGTADYLNARDTVVGRFPDSVDVMRHRVVKTNFAQINNLLETVLQSNGNNIGPYDMSFFDDIPCTFESASAKELYAGSWSIDAQCKEYYRSYLSIKVWPEKSNFSVSFQQQNKKLQISKISEDYAAVYQLNPASLKKTRE